MKIVKHILLILLFFQAITTHAQKVSNITFRQEQSTIIVSYDLETKTPCKVSLYVSTDGDITWKGPLTKVTGDVGNKIVSGNNNITWNVLDEFQELKGDNIKFQVKAISNEIETVTIGNQVWMKKNLDVSTYRNGDIIPEVKDSKEWENLKTGAWCFYENDHQNTWNASCQTVQWGQHDACRSPQTKQTHTTETTGLQQYGRQGCGPCHAGLPQ